MFYFIQFIYETIIHSHPWWIIFGNTIGEIGIIALEVFILFLLMQTSAGTKALKRAYKATAIVCAIELIIILIKHFYGETKRNYILFCVGELLEELLLFCIFIGVFIYSYFYQIVKNRKRERNKILYVYILLLCTLLLIIIIAYILLIFKIDGYCLDIIDQYLFRLLFPWIAFITIRSDSEFWRLLLLSWQTSSTLPKGEAGDGKGESDNIWDKIKTIFGTGGVGEGKKSFLNPLIDALSMGVRMVDFTELQETSDPIAMGSTATVSKAKLYGETVAIKVFIFDELSIEVVSEFFRESLLISDLHHENIVEFKGACLRPPELCLVYEYCCCGDLTHLLLTQYFHSNFLHNNEDLLNNKDRQDPKIFDNRLKMLIDVSRGMTRLHDAGIIHRDLKTSNILVHYKLGKYVAKVCDFGSARKILTGNGMNMFGDNVARPNAKSSYTPPKRLEHAKSHDFVSNEDLANKQIVKSIQHKVRQNKLGKTIKKHQVVVENKPHHKISKSNQDMDIITNKLHKQDSKHGRSMTVNLSHGLFGWKIKRKNNPNKPTNTLDRNTIISHSETNDEKTEQQSQQQSMKPKHKPSVNYDDMEEEEKYDQPQPYNTNINTPEGDFDDIDTKTEATDYLTELNSSLNDRDPTKLAFSVSPLLLTTQVGTLAFMAPEILSHVNIGALSGGWANKKEETEEKLDEKEEFEDNLSTESENNLEIMPSKIKPNNIANNPSGNHLQIGDLPRYHESTTTTATTDTATSNNSLQSDTIVIKIDTKTDPNYQKKNNNNNNYLSSPSVPSSFTNPKSAQTAPIAIPNRNKNQNIISKKINKLNSFEMREMKKRFSREYINKHRQFAQHGVNIASAPRKGLPPSPKKRTISGVSNSLKKLKMFSSSLNTNNNDMIRWQNRDIFFYNNPLPPNPNNYKLPNSLTSDKQLKVPKNKKLPALPTENNDSRFSTISSVGFGKLIEPKNVQSYINRALPPDPPKRRNKPKVNYFTRGRTQSKFSVRSNMLSKSKSHKTIASIEVDDDVRSVIYETQKFEIIYEASNQALYNDSVDMYSFGVIMWEVALCDRIYNQMDMRQIRDMVCQGKRMDTPSYRKCKKLKNGLADISNSVYNALMELLNDCWAQSPIDRPKFYEIQNRLELIQNLHQMKMEQIKNKNKIINQYHE